jgi:hypothetical protein
MRLQMKKARKEGRIGLSQSLGSDLLCGAGVNTLGRGE